MTQMTYRRLGRSGLTVSAVGLGCNNFGKRIDAKGTRAVVDAAIDAGITLFDTSDSYGTSEELLGEALGTRRRDLILATKFGSDLKGENGADWGARGSRRYIRRAIERSLRRLRTDWIDLYQLHWPDPETPLEETLSALTELVREGKVRYLGSSNLKGWQVTDAEWLSRTRGLERFISAQNEYSLIGRGVEEDLVPALQQHGIGLLPYFPLASGLLTGKYKRGAAAPENTRVKHWNMGGLLTDATFDAVERLEAFARERSLTLLDVAIGGLAARPTVGSVIAGATSAEQVKTNARAGAWKPTAEDLTALEAILPRGRGISVNDVLRG
ncbi:MULTISPECIES: aldo/keto reductase [Myxococcus]|uniref:Aldo/keto reductase n=1 Tax=Myxococcus llanfairpwllgwyngyllgogerychwyrndrobwllllantysiliogogogochensis TaxID=2590453 RepID=A0A540WQD7_9BACT|nr:MULTISPECIES: aldo/keto reductase [Myxococcus]NTX02085.1 aldo/keto reductase [Myxococcus sp. CA040A]TQF11222.1 aldo/keto reductase [Myxococcus llanfairpwllgwyngyllgogerychwyrndrobwllllantysiliogogogochensis]